MKLNISQRLKIRVNQLRYRSKTSEPLLSGDAFRNVADVRIDSLENLREEDWEGVSGKLIFCRSELLEELIHCLEIPQRGISVIAGNSDRNFEEVPINLLEYFEYSFLQNSQISDNNKIFTLPIGIENLRLGINGLPRNLRSTTPWIQRSRSILVGPFSPSHKSREIFLANETFRSSNFNSINGSVLPSEYAKIVQKHRFVICPRGNGIDTHRFWETLYRGSVPIVLRDPWSQSLKIHNLPMVEVEEFSEDSIGQAVIAAEKSGAYDEFDPVNIPALWIDYWKRFLRK